MNRKEVLQNQIDQYNISKTLANAPETLAEDNAFMNRMRIVAFRNFEEPDMKRLWRIALRGISARRELEAKGRFS